MRIFAILFATATLLIAGTALASGGEGENTDCNGQGNPNSFCTGGGGGEEGGGGGGGGAVVTVTNSADASASASASAEAVAVQGQFQGQEQFQAQGNEQNLVIEDARNPASSAASLYLANCTSGASGQGFGGGGSVGGPDEVCLLLNTAIVAHTLGQPELEEFAVERVTALLKERTNFIVRFFQLFPIIRRVI